MNPFAGQQWRHGHREQICGHSWGRRGWDEWREQHWIINMTISKIDSQWGLAGWCRAQVRCSVTTSRGSMWWEVTGRFKKEGTYMYLWLIHVGVWQKPTQYCKAIILQLKINFKKARRKHSSTGHPKSKCHVETEAWKGQDRRLDGLV